MRTTALVSALVLSLAGTVTAFTPPTPDAQAQAVKGKVKQAVEKTSAWMEAAIDWMSEKGGRLKEGANGWRDSAETKLKAAVDDALSLPAAPTGMRLLAIDDSPSGKPKWIALFDVPVQLPKRMVVLVHGMDEPGNVWDDLSPMLRADGYAVARFDYADDQPCLLSADELGQGLKTLRSRGVERIDLVCHSMGGLIAREVLTRQGLYEGDASADHADGKLPSVGRFIMLGTPNHGSCLARVRFIAEAREHLVRWLDSDGKDPRLLLGFLKDGAGEAGVDLCPDSPFIMELNKRPLPRNVKITNIVGTIAEGQVEMLADVLRSDWVRKVLDDEEIKKLTRGVQLAAGVLGDGVVTADSTMLEGVDDVVHVWATHRTIVKRPLGEDTVKDVLGEPRRIPSGVPVILERLRQP
jgi:pimeloyl-ACP methyl ester carboxylesterase